MNLTPQYGLGRLKQFDPRSRQFGVVKELPAEAYRVPRSYTWGIDVTLDQGPDGACVGFAWAHELAARPAAIQNVNYNLAFGLYKKAKELDPWQGEDYEGTSVLAGVKALQTLYPGALKGFRWCFSIEDMQATIGYWGPIVIGVNWYSGMFKPDHTGIIRATGSLQGGHAILVRGVSPKNKLFRLHNSWGPGWGLNGDCFITYDDMSRLLSEEGEACIPQGRHRVQVV